MGETVDLALAAATGTMACNSRRVLVQAGRDGTTWRTWEKRTAWGDRNDFCRNTKFVPRGPSRAVGKTAAGDRRTYAELSALKPYSHHLWIS